MACRSRALQAQLPQSNQCFWCPTRPNVAASVGNKLRKGQAMATEALLSLFPVKTTTCKHKLFKVKNMLCLNGSVLIPIILAMVTGINGAEEGPNAQENDYEDQEKAIEEEKHDEKEEHNHGQIDLGIASFWFFVILISSIVSVILPFWQKKRLDNLGGFFINLINSLGAGLLLGSCFFHLVPEMVEKFVILAKGDAHQVAANVKRSQEMMVVGFLFVLVIEKVTIWAFTPEEAGHYVACGAHDHGPCHANGESSPSTSSSSSQSKPSLEDAESCLLGQTPREWQNQKTLASAPVSIDLAPSNPGNTSKSKLTTEEQKRCVRAFILVFSISIHCIFEGMTLGIMSHSWTASTTLAVSLFLHKVAVGLTLGLQVFNAPIKHDFVKILLLLFWAVVTPIGQIIGAVTHGKIDEVFQAYVNGFACGTFLYVLFVEIIPAAFSCQKFQDQDKISSKHGQIMCIALMLAGVLAVWLMGYFFPHNCNHDHSPPAAPFLDDPTADGLQGLSNDWKEKRVQVNKLIEEFQQCHDNNEEKNDAHGHEHGDPWCEDIFKAPICQSDPNSYLTSKFFKSHLESKNNAPICVPMINIPINMRMFG